MRRFTMYRRNVPDTTHNADQKNLPDQPQFEGVVFSDGTVAVRWLTAKVSTSVWECMDDMLAIHGHPEYGSELIWHDDPGSRPLRQCPQAGPLKPEEEVNLDVQEQSVMHAALRRSARPVATSWGEPVKATEDGRAWEITAHLRWRSGVLEQMWRDINNGEPRWFPVESWEW